eukprot:CAMPEP_0170538488 /NCGR_PEP_ID=MMETSP0209-20121228/103343_1 /TAXON_ID=665100 ORGANISM="Litonotus pictus, Strain P1" /NCGR_SAMPLE_ID=MMETSP0209 /ASSEMBLY_ACC=CAM_ASM_000301 /LENGTH=353 /DNA_ID=CAMNT_0010840189 /DNA_START=65 /DNA_END=1122 /DNA_ORIENTATION=+
MISNSTNGHGSVQEGELDNKTKENSNEILYSPNDKKAKQIIYLSQNTSSIRTEELQAVTWNGIPFELPQIRSLFWKLLLKYIPLSSENRDIILKRKRQEYYDTCIIYDSMLQDPNKNMNDSELKTYKQISVDIPRTLTEYKLFTSSKVKKMMLRLLFVWAKRHPASGYVQGFNDLCSSFIAVFFSNYLKFSFDDFEVSDTDLNNLSEDHLFEIEADSYWCFKKMMDNIQTNYISGQPGLQKMMNIMEKIVKTVDYNLWKHLKKLDISYLQFSFRWMNCYLMREFSLKMIIRLWDSYFALNDSFNFFHLFVCACFLLNYSEKLKAMSEFQEVIMFLQNPPTNNWSEVDMNVLVA